jgi:hypothetical protein
MQNPLCVSIDCPPLAPSTGYQVFLRSALSLAKQEMDNELNNLNRMELGLGSLDGAIRIVGLRWQAMENNDRAMWNELAMLGSA